MDSVVKEDPKSVVIDGESPISVAALSKGWVCGRLLAKIAGSNRAGGLDICRLWVLCVVRYVSLKRADHSSGGVLPNVVCLGVSVNSR
jgi:hypothetical protein